MPSVFWIGIGFAACIFVIATISGARSTSGSAATGAAIGLFMGVMLAFPLIAIGLASS